MSPNLLEAADATIQYLQFSTSLFLIILTANGIAFFTTGQQSWIRLKQNAYTYILEYQQE